MIAIARYWISVEYGEYKFVENVKLYVRVLRIVNILCSETRGHLG